MHMSSSPCTYLTSGNWYETRMRKSKALHVSCWFTHNISNVILELMFVPITGPLKTNLTKYAKYVCVTHWIIHNSHSFARIKIHHHIYFIEHTLVKVCYDFSMLTLGSTKILLNAKPFDTFSRLYNQLSTGWQLVILFQVWCSLHLGDQQLHEKNRVQQQRTCKSIKKHVSHVQGGMVYMPFLSFKVKICILFCWI